MNPALFLLASGKKNGECSAEQHQ